MENIDIWSIILNQLDISELFKLLLVNKKFKDIILLNKSNLTLGRNGNLKIYPKIQFVKLDNPRLIGYFNNDPLYYINGNIFNHDQSILGNMDSYLMGQILSNKIIAFQLQGNLKILINNNYEITYINIENKFIFKESRYIGNQLISGNKIFYLYYNYTHRVNGIPLIMSKKQFGNTDDREIRIQFDIAIRSFTVNKKYLLINDNYLYNLITKTPCSAELQRFIIDNKITILYYNQREDKDIFISNFNDMLIFYDESKTQLSCVYKTKFILIDNYVLLCYKNTYDCFNYITGRYVYRNLDLSLNTFIYDNIKIKIDFECYYNQYRIEVY